MLQNPRGGAQEKEPFFSAALIGACANKWEASAKTKKMTHFGFLEKIRQKSLNKLFQQIFSRVKKKWNPM